MTEDIRKLAEDTLVLDGQAAPLGHDDYTKRLYALATAAPALARAVLAIDEALFEAGHGDHEDGEGCAICAAMNGVTP